MFSIRLCALLIVFVLAIDQHREKLLRLRAALD
jgi:hypothetical protein